MQVHLFSFIDNNNKYKKNNSYIVISIITKNIVLYMVCKLYNHIRIHTHTHELSD